MLRLTIRPLALQDISEIAEYLYVQSGSELADRFVSAIEGDLHRLCQLPDIGSPCHFQRTEVQNLRRWAVNGFERWLVFYLPKNTAIEIIRVLHGARNISEILD